MDAGQQAQGAKQGHSKGGLPLFRAQAVAARHSRLEGELLLSQPLATRVLTRSLALLVAVALGFLATGTYTRKVSVEGRLVPAGGLIDVRAGGRGQVAELLVAPGDSVAAGQPLFRLLLDHTLGGDDALTTELSADLQRQREHLQAQLQLQLAALERQQRSAAEQSALLEDGSARIEVMLQRGSELAALQQQALQRAGRLAQRGQLAKADHESVQLQALQQAQALQELELQRLQQQMRRQELQAQHALALEQGLQQVERLRAELAELDQRLRRVAAEQDILQRAPLAARVGAVHLQPGMPVAPDQSVLALLPEDAVLHAELQVPGSAIGFMEPGQSLQLRYAAYPYQKFGAQVARLDFVMPSPEPLRQGDPAEPRYRVLASPERQTMQAYGRSRPLLAGMQFTAEVQLDRRSLLEWLLEPLFSIRGRA